MGLAACSGPADKILPNVVVILTDDQGYEDLSAHGNPVLRTPCLDSFREQAVRFSDFHSAPMSTATRGQLMTGVDALRNGASNVSSGRTFLRPDLPTMGEIFRDAGYRTALFGKWHLGETFPYNPENRGFEYTLRFPSSHIGSIPDVWGNDYFDDTYICNGKQETVSGYCTDVFFSRASQWVGDCADKGEPFFLYLAPNAPHGPFNAPQPYVDSVHERMLKADSLGVRSKRMKDLEVYLAMIECLDENIGRFLGMLDERGLADNTVVVFMTDNGSVLDTYVPNPSRRGKKGQMYDGGHRVPCFIRWNRGFAGGRDIDGLSEVQDILPTLLDLCGIRPPEGTRFDGVSLAPALREGKPLPERTLCVNYSKMPTMFAYPSPYGTAQARRGETVVMKGSWRLVADRELYNISDDPLQKKDVFSEYPEVVESLRREAGRWWEGVSQDANRKGVTYIGIPGTGDVALTSCEWVNVFTDQQSQVMKGTRRNSYWLLDIAREGRYRFELRRWPRELDMPLRGAPLGGNACDVATAKILIASGASTFEGLEAGGKTVSATRAVSDGDVFSAFEFDLPAGPAVLHTWFDDSAKEPLFGAYYVYVSVVGE